MFISSIYINQGYVKKGFINLDNILEVHEMCNPREYLKEFMETHYYVLTTRTDIGDILVNKKEFDKAISKMK